jgi:hypothetical protein
MGLSSPIHIHRKLQVHDLMTLLSASSPKDETDPARPRHHPSFMIAIADYHAAALMVWSREGLIG